MATASADAMVLGPASGVVGTLISLEVMHVLLGRPAATEGRAMLLDIQTFETRWEPVERDPDCPVCSQRFACAGPRPGGRPPPVEHRPNAG